MDLVDIYEKLEAERRQHSEAIIDARTPKKVIVAGPGTGKTFLFKEALKGKSLTLTLTFVNSLVEDLSLELYGLSDVKTLGVVLDSIISKFHTKENNQNISKTTSSNKRRCFNPKGRRHRF